MSDWQDFSVLTELEHLVSTCEGILGRLLSAPPGVYREQFHSPAGIEYVLSIVRRSGNAQDSACAAAARSGWLARSALSPAMVGRESAEARRLIELCDWACFPVVAVITHAFSSSDFFGEISSSQAGSLLSALHLALMHAGLGGSVPAIVQIYEPSRGAFIGCWPSSATAAGAPSFVRFKSDATFYAGTPPRSAPSYSIGSAVDDSRGAASPLPPLPQHFSTPRGALVQFCTRLLPPDALASVQQPHSYDSPWGVYRRLLRSAYALELCTAFGVTPSLRLSWTFQASASVDAIRHATETVAPASSTADTALSARAPADAHLPPSLQRVEVHALWSAMPVWSQTTAPSTHGGRSCSCCGNSSVTADSSWAYNAIDVESGCLLMAADAALCTALAVRVHWTLPASPDGLRNLMRCHWSRWLAVGVGCSHDGSADASSSVAGGAGSALWSMPQQSGHRECACSCACFSEPLRGFSPESHSRGGWGSSATVPFDAVATAFDEARHPSAWFAAAALLGAIAAHTLVQDAAESAAATLSTDASALPSYLAQQAEESAAAYGLEAWAAMSPEPPQEQHHGVAWAGTWRSSEQPQPEQSPKRDPLLPPGAEELHGAAGSNGVTLASESQSQPPHSQPKAVFRKRPASPFSPLRSPPEDSDAVRVGTGDSAQAEAAILDTVSDHDASDIQVPSSGPRLRGSGRPRIPSGFAAADDAEGASAAAPPPDVHRRRGDPTEDGAVSPPPQRRTRRRSRLRAALRSLPVYALGARLGGALAGAAADIAASAAATLPPTHALATPPRPSASVTAAGDGDIVKKERTEATPSQAQQHRLAATAAAWAQQEALTAAAARSCALLAGRGAISETVRWIFGHGEELSASPGAAPALLAARLELAFSALAALAIRRAPELQIEGGAARGSAADEATQLRSHWSSMAASLDRATAPVYGALRMGLMRDGVGSGDSSSSVAGVPASPPRLPLLHRLDAAAALAVTSSRGEDPGITGGSSGSGVGDLSDALASHASIALMCVLWHAFVAECRRRWDAGETELPHTTSASAIESATGPPSLLQQWCDLLSACMARRSEAPSHQTGHADDVAVDALIGLSQLPLPTSNRSSTMTSTAQLSPVGIGNAAVTDGPCALPGDTESAAGPPISPSSDCKDYEDACGSDTDSPSRSPPLTVRELRLHFPGGAAAVAALREGGAGATLLLGDCDDLVYTGEPSTRLRDTVVTVTVRLVTPPTLLPSPLRRTDLHAAEDARALAAMGLGGLRSVRGEGGLSLRVLLSDMAAFKAANAGAGLVDFLRWYYLPETTDASTDALRRSDVALSGGAEVRDADGGALLTALEAAESVLLELPGDVAAGDGGGVVPPTSTRPADPALIGASLRALRIAHSATNAALAGLRTSPRIGAFASAAGAEGGAPPSSDDSSSHLVLAWTAREVAEADTQQLQVWRSVWAAATPGAALRPLFDPLREGELALHALETLAPTDVAGQLTVLAGQRLVQALAAPAPPPSPLSASPTWTAVRAAAAADAAAHLGASALQVHGAALRAHSRAAGPGGAARAPEALTGQRSAAGRPLAAAACSLQLWDALAADVFARGGRAAALAAAMLPISGPAPAPEAAGAAVSLATALALPNDRDAPLVLAVCAGARAAALHLLGCCSGRGELGASLPPPHQRSLQLLSSWVHRGGAVDDPASLPLGGASAPAPALAQPPHPCASCGAAHAPSSSSAPDEPPSSTLVVVESYDPRAPEGAPLQRVGLRVTQALRLQGL